MEASGANSNAAYRTTVAAAAAFTPNNNPAAPTHTSSRRHLSASRILRSPVSAFLEYSGILRTARSSHRDRLHSRLQHSSTLPPSSSPSLSAAAAVPPVPGEISIRIFSSSDQDLPRVASPLPSPPTNANLCRDLNSQNEVSSHPIPRPRSAVSLEAQSHRGGPADAVAQSTVTSMYADAADGSGANIGDSANQQYDIQLAARWIEQLLPFSLLLLIVFIRLHLQGFFVTIWITTVLFKSNDILRKQTALKGERKISVLTAISLVVMFHVVGIYWLLRDDEILHQLVMLPPKAIPPFWHALFVIIVNDTLVRQTAMVFKCVLLMYHKNSRGQSFRKQGQMLTLVEYLLLLYRTLLPAPVWYRFFLNKAYGSLFSSLITGLYLTFKLTSLVEKVQSIFTALKALSCKEIHYGAYATSEQVNAAGDLCAICQEKMHAPVLLRCSHIFCEDCVFEWFERERTCPLCRALVKPADLRSFGDGSTSLIFQLF